MSDNGNNKKTGSNVNAYTLFLILILLILSENVLLQLKRLYQRNIEMGEYNG